MKTDLIFCLSDIDSSFVIMKRIFTKLNDRLRLFGGVRQLSTDAILPIIILPAMICLAAINFYFMIGICIVMPLFLGYAQWLRKTHAPRTKFFFMWTFWSGIYLYVIFEITVPLMELLPEENFIFISTMFGAAFCFYKVSENFYCVLYCVICIVCYKF